MVLGALMYSADYDDRLPPIEGWSDLLDPYVEADIDKIVDSPAQEDTVLGMNRNLGRTSFLDFYDPAAQVLFAERTGKGINLLVDEQTEFKGEGRIIAFSDGHAKWVLRKASGDYYWDRYAAEEEPSPDEPEDSP